MHWYLYQPGQIKGYNPPAKMHLTPLFPLLAFALGTCASPAAAPEELQARQSAPLVGTCTVATNQCAVTFPGSGSPYNFTCGLIVMPAVPPYIYEPARCTEEGHVRTYLPNPMSLDFTRL